MKNFLKHGWFFTITAIFVFINLFDGEYLRVITSIAVYFFIEIGLLLIAFKQCVNINVDVEVKSSDPK